jgi:hypothetical protein
MPLSVGDRLGPYEILAPIGAGGMGEVYKARDTRLDRIVAGKVSKTEFNERFEREARAIATLNHPHICTLFDVGANYLVMEYVEGAPLVSKEKPGPLPLDQALKYAAEICDALDAAHQPTAGPADRSHVGREDGRPQTDSVPGHTGRRNLRPVLARHQWIAYSADESGRREVYVQGFVPDHVPAAGIGKWQISKAGGDKRRWRRDGKELYYIAPDGKMMAVPVKSTIVQFTYFTVANSQKAFPPCR